ncbi:MAG: DUF5615 family PIN-like protein [Bryobacteraceae bacterium]
MRFLIDNALPPRLSALLKAAGHNAVHVREFGMQSAEDERIFAKAFEEDRIIVSADTDFGALLAAMEASHPSFVLFRDPEFLAAEDYARVLIGALPLIEVDLASGCVAVFRSGHLRVRKLPL